MMAYNANSGYSGWSMSINACEAYEDGEMPKSKWTKTAMLGAVADWCLDNEMQLREDVAKLRKDEIFSRFFCRSSWHHTSKFFNETDFYSLDENAVKGVCGPMDDGTLQCIKDAVSLVDEEYADMVAEGARLEAELKMLLEEAGTREDYVAAHGFHPDSVQAYIEMHPDGFTERVSRKGNRIIGINGRDYRGDDSVFNFDARFDGVGGLTIWKLRLLEGGFGLPMPEYPYAKALDTKRKMVLMLSGKEGANASKA